MKELNVRMFKSWKLTNRKKKKNEKELPDSATIALDSSPCEAGEYVIEHFVIG